jgi:hypothetical protein
MTKLNSKVPKGPIKDKWTTYKDNIDLVNPANKRNIDIIVVGTGLAGGSAAATLAELGYNVKAFAYQDSPRRAHSIAAQGGINAAKNYMGDGDSNYRLFYDTVKGGDYRSREANVHRLAEVSGNIIDQCVAQGVPFARDYGGLLDNRSFGGVLVSRTFYAKGQTGQQLLLGAYSAMNRQIARGKIEMFNRHEMLDVVIVDRKARGIIARNLITGEIERHSAADADKVKAIDIIINAKTAKISACNAVDKVLIDTELPGYELFVKELIEKLNTEKVTVLGAGDISKFKGVEKNEDESLWFKEFLDYKILLGSVGSLAEAIKTINTYGGGHSASIVSENAKEVDHFLSAVDAAAVYHNASTRFTDGFQFGLGGELAISTDKLHQRGPIGLQHLVTNKWYVYGNGQIR